MERKTWEQRCCTDFQTRLLNEPDRNDEKLKIEENFFYVNLKRLRPFCTINIIQMAESINTILK
jgi:hypothetical protein